MMNLYWGVRKGSKLCRVSGYIDFVMEKFRRGHFKKLKPILTRCRNEGIADEATRDLVLAYYERFRSGHYTRCFDIKDLSTITAAYIKKIWGKSVIVKLCLIIYTCDECNRHMTFECFFLKEAFKRVDPNFHPLGNVIEGLANEYYSVMRAKKCLDPRWDCPIQIDQKRLDIIKKEGMGNT